MYTRLKYIVTNAQMTEMPPTLDGYQRHVVDWLQQKPKAIVALEQGLGKTCIAAVDMVAPATVICPATMLFTWQDELAKWRPELKVQVITGGKTVIDTSADVHVVSYSMAVRMKLPKPVTVVADEAHYIKSPTAKRSRSVAELLAQAPRARVMSGTPVVNSPIDLWLALRALGATKLNYTAFGIRYCAGYQNIWKGWDFTGLSNEDALIEILDKVMIRLTKAQCLKDLPPKIYRVIELDLPVDKREKKLSRDEIEKLPENVAFQAISDILRLNAQHKLPLAVDHIQDILASEQKVVVFAYHTEIIDALCDELKAFDPVQITGRDSAKARHAAVHKFQTDPKCRVFVGNYVAAGVGVTLTAASRVVFVESSWVPADIEQAADRCHRRGQKDTVMVDILTIHKSIDAQMLHKVIGKMEIINQIVKENPMNLSANTVSALADLLRKAADVLEAGVATNEPAAVAAPAPAAVEAAPAAEPAKPAAAAPKITIEAIRELAAKLIAEGKGADVRKAISASGASKLSELDPSQYAVAYGKLTDLEAV